MNNSFTRGPRPPRNQVQKEELHLINNKIRVPQVRVIDQDGNNLGVIDTYKALNTAIAAEFDLVLINPDATPPVAKIVDYGKFLYLQKQQKKEQQKKSREAAIVVKEIQLRPVTGSHDVEIKLKHAKEWLEQKNRIKIVMKFRGREQHHTDIGRKLMQSFIQGLGECKIDQEPEMAGRQMIAMIAPAKA
jgi:translation initiation factor IF-3